MDLSQIPPGLELPKGIPARLRFESHEDAREHRKRMLVAASTFIAENPKRNSQSFS